MKTPIQEFIDDLQHTADMLEALSYDDLVKGVHASLIVTVGIAQSLLEKEKEVMCEFADDYQRNCFQKSADDYFKETFNTKEK